MTVSSKDKLFELIYQEFRDPIYRTCCYYVADQDARQDLFQDILMKIWRGLDTLQNPGAMKTWVYRISTNTALSVAIKDKKRRTQNLEYHLDHKMPHPPHDDEMAGEQQDQIKRLMKCVNQLPEKDRILIGMVLEELDTREMAEITGLSEVNVRVRIHRSKKRLKELMEGV